MRTINFAMMALFAYTGVVQLNDPDPIPWLLVYAGGVAFCWLWAIGEFPSTLGFVFAGVCLLTAILLFVQTLDKGFWHWSEKLDGASGLFVLFLWVSTLGWLDWRQKGQAPLA
jgi:hypothetical protein